MKKITFLLAMIFAGTIAFAQQPEVVLDDWDGNQYPGYEFNLWSNPNCWCVWNSTVANPSTDGINDSDSCMYYPAHNWLDQTWWYYQEGMLGFKKLPANYLKDYKYVYLEYLVGEDVSYAGAASEESTIGDTVRIKLKFAGATSDNPLTTDVLYELIITEADLYTWKAITLEIPEAVRNSDYTILNFFTGANPSEEMEIELYYDNIGLTNTEEKFELDEGTIIDDWDGNQYPTYEFNLWSNPNCWCVWSSTVANPSTDGINTSDSSMYYPAHNWLDQTWWYYQEGMMGFKKLPTSYLQDHQYLYFEYLVGDDVSYAGVASEESPIGDTIRIKLKFAGATSASPLTTDVLHELIITEADLNIWKTAIFEIPEDVRNADYTILNVFTGANPSEEMEIEFYYDNVKLANEAVDNTTQTPILTSPADNDNIHNSVFIDFTLPEEALAGSVKMTFTQTGGVADPNSPHEIIFKTNFETEGNHTTTLYSMNLGDNDEVDNVSSEPNDLLVHESVYSIKLDYQDALGNPADMVIAENVLYTDTTGTGITTVSSRNDFHVFMDGNMCNIRMDEFIMLESVAIYNITGSVVHQEPINSEVRDFAIPLTLDSGIYIIKLNSHKQAYTKKFIHR